VKLPPASKIFISTQFTFEMCAAAENWEKHSNPLLCEFKVI